jgi:transposase InsO family protein
LCSPLSSPSFYGCNYFLTLIDDFSRRTWVYFLKLKSEVFDKFLAYKALVEKQSGHQIQRLRTDNGGKYVNNNFTSYYTTQGIQMQHIVPYTPQQNGVDERKNRTLKKMANCMIQSKGLSLKYWAEAINCANYIVNHTPTKALKNITSEEAWTKIKPYVSHFRVFGSIAWAHIPDEKRKALSLKVRSVYLLVILKMSKVTNFFNHIVMKLLLEEMLNLMKISRPASLIRRLCLL